MPYKIDNEGNWWYISNKQRTKACEFICDHCSNKFFRLKSAIKLNKPKYCSKICSNQVTALKHKRTRRGDGNPMWNGGRKVVQGGYIKIYKPDHPNADNKNCVLEHRLVMEEHLGRYLYKFESVHHKNGVTNDNRISNLQLMVSKHPKGQTPEDLVTWAKEILILYNKI